MAKLVYISTNSNAMHSINISPGQVLYCGDMTETYYDTSGGKRVLINKVRYFYTDTDRLAVTVDRLNTETLYVVTSKGTFYRWSLSTDWQQVLYTADLFDVVDLFENLVPSTIEQYGTKVAPRTLASQVFTKAGERVQDVLDDITRLGKTYRYITSDGSNSYEIPMPFKNYLELGNYIELYINNQYVAPKYYNIDPVGDGSRGTLTFANGYAAPSNGKEIAITYTYNTTRVRDTVYDGYNGNYIVDGTIPLRKLEKYSDSYLVDDSNSAATSKAVYNLYSSMNEKVTLIAGNLIAYATSYNTGAELKTDIPNFQVVDNSTIYLTLHEPVIKGATLSVNGGLPVPIYLNYKTPIESGLDEGDVLSLTYSKMYNKFFVNSSVAYRLNHYRQLYECVGGDTTIVIDMPDFIQGYDTLHVTHNNLKLVEGVNFVVNGHNLVLLYTPEAGDIIELEMDKVMGNGLPMDGNTIMKEITFTEQVIFKGGPVSLQDVNVLLPNGGYIDKETGDIHGGGNISAEGKITGSILESTINDGETPPLIVNSSVMVPNLNADMVDNYHADDMTLPDRSIEFIIDGESDIMDPAIQIALRSFLGRISTLQSRLIGVEDSDRIKPEKQSYYEVFGYEYEWDPNEALFNENIRDTLEEVVYQLDELRFAMVKYDTLDDLNISLDDINEMNGREFVKTDYLAPEQTNLLGTWADMAAYIDYALLTLEAEGIKACDQDTHDVLIAKEHEAVLDAIENFDPTKYLEENMNPDFDWGDWDLDETGASQATGMRAIYLKTNKKRFYPITHRNAIVGLPFGNLATEKSVIMLQEANDFLTSRIEYLEDVIKAILGGESDGGDTGLLVKFAGLRTKLD